MQKNCIRKGSESGFPGNHSRRFLEEQEKDRAEIREYLARFQNPKHLSFSELLAQNKTGSQDSDDEGFVLDIKKSAEALQITPDVDLSE